MKIVGHRGARHLAPENTLNALEIAIKHGVDEIEIDVRVTRDGHVVLHHDPVVRAKTGETYTISTHTLEELRAKKSDITTLAAAVNTVKRRVPLMIEVKPRQPIAPIVSIIEAFLADGWEPKDFMFGSFSQSILRQLHETLPQIELVVIEAYASFRATYRARQVGAHKVSINHRLLWFANVAAMRRKNYEVYTWTLNDPRKAERLRKSGLSGTITDNPKLYTKD
ncbi:MAG: glycerophosphodiester phosphodiesterase [Candidatus Saccharibacteria bacterium]